MGLLLDIFDPPSKPSDSMGFIILGGLLVDVVIDITKNFWNSIIVILKVKIR